jgi:hypothetical protein
MTPLVEWLVRAVVLGALVSAGAWALEEALRGWSRPSRFVWIGALLLSIALPLLAVAAPSLWPDALTRTVTVVSVSDLPVSVTGSVLDPSFVLPARSWSLVELLVPVWMLISSVFALRWLHGWWRLRRARAGWRAARVQGHAVYVSERLGPAVVGLNPPRVVLPAWLLTADDERLALIVRHESEHARAGDPWLLAFAPIAAVLFPWSPAIWWQLHRLRLAIELDCDARVLRSGVPALAYGSVLLDVASGNLPLHPTLAALSEPRSLLERRIRAMTPSRYQHLVLRAAALLAVTTATLFGAALIGAPATQVSAQAKPTPAPARVTPPPTPPQVIPPPAAAPAPQAQDGDPVFVIDGVVQGRRTKLDAVVSKLHVGTIEVLKPADAVRRFGERGRFGAVLVTTVPPVEAKLPLDESVVNLKVRDFETSKAGLDQVMRAKVEQGLLEAQGVSAHKVKSDLGDKIKQSAASDPIFIVDGVIFPAGFAPLKQLDPNLIDSIEILKGNAAISAYGEGARQGVIIIKLKH